MISEQTAQIPGWFSAIPARWYSIYPYSRWYNISAFIPGLHLVSTGAHRASLQLWVSSLIFLGLCFIYKPFFHNPQAPGKTGKSRLCSHGSQHAGFRDAMSGLPKDAELGPMGSVLQRGEGRSQHLPKSPGIPPLHPYLYTQAGVGHGNS